MTALALMVMAVLLFALRDTVIVPLVTGGFGEVGEYFFVDGFWTPAVNIGLSACAVSSVVLLLLSALARRPGS